MWSEPLQRILEKSCSTGLGAEKVYSSKGASACAGRLQAATSYKDLSKAKLVGSNRSALRSSHGTTALTIPSNAPPASLNIRSVTLRMFMNVAGPARGSNENNFLEALELSAVSKMHAVSTKTDSLHSPQLHLYRGRWGGRKKLVKVAKLQDAAEGGLFRTCHRWAKPSYGCALCSSQGNNVSQDAAAKGNLSRIWAPSWGLTLVSRFHGAMPSKKVSAAGAGCDNHRPAVAEGQKDALCSVFDFRGTPPSKEKNTMHTTQGNSSS